MAAAATFCSLSRSRQPRLHRPQWRICVNKAPFQPPCSQAPSPDTSARHTLVNIISHDKWLNLKNHNQKGKNENSPKSRVFNQLPDRIGNRQQLSARRTFGRATQQHLICSKAQLPVASVNGRGPRRSRGRDEVGTCSDEPTQTYPTVTVVIYK